MRVGRKRLRTNERHALAIGPSCPSCPSQLDKQRAPKDGKRGAVISAARVVCVCDAFSAPLNTEKTRRGEELGLAGSGL